MALLNVFDIAGSGMAAQTVRMNTTASNIANAQSVAEDGEATYRARYPVFAAHLQQAQLGQVGVENDAASEPVSVLGIVQSDAPLNMRYEPDHPYADEAGYVAYPNVNAVEEMANMISASRSFQLNVEVMSAVRTLSERVLALGQ